jgi:hypothetical protein
MPDDIERPNWMPAPIVLSPEEQAKHDANQRAYNLGRDAGLLGLPKPPEASQWAYDRAVVERRGRAGEAIVVVSNGTRCTGCGESNWGYRLGCRCWTSEQTMAAFKGESGAPAVEWGAFVYALGDSVDAPFMTYEELKAAAESGKPVLTDTGEPVEFKGAP